MFFRINSNMKKHLNKNEYINARGKDEKKNETEKESAAEQENVQAVPLNNRSETKPLLFFVQKMSRKDGTGMRKKKS